MSSGFIRIRNLALAACVAVVACLASGARASLLVTNATFLTMKPGETMPIVGYMLVDDSGRIAMLASGAPPTGLQATTMLDATGKIVIPGFVSAHSHAWQSPLRGIGADQYTPGWGVALRRYSVHATNEDLYWFTLHGALDHLRHGVTTIFNFGYSHRVGEYNNEQLQGLLDSGTRFVHAFAQARSIPADQQYQSFLHYYEFAKLHLSNPKFLRVGNTGSGATIEQARLDKRLMDEFGVLTQAHYLEAPVDREKQQKQFHNFIDAGTLGPLAVNAHPDLHAELEIFRDIGNSRGETTVR